MKDIGKIKRSVTLTNEQWQDVIMCIQHEQLEYEQGREGWEAYVNELPKERLTGVEEIVNAEMNAEYCDEMTRKLEEIRMTIGGDVAADEQT